MTTKLAEFIDAGQALDADEREVAVLALQQDDTSESDKLDPSWLPELQRRMDDIQAGQAQLLDFDDSHAILRAELAAGRQ